MTNLNLIDKIELERKVYTLLANEDITELEESIRNLKKPFQVWQTYRNSGCSWDDLQIVWKGNTWD